jgi:hypothetical protein
MYEDKNGKQLKFEIDKTKQNKNQFDDENVKWTVIQNWTRFVIYVKNIQKAKTNPVPAGENQLNYNWSRPEENININNDIMNWMLKSIF